MAKRSSKLGTAGTTLLQRPRTGAEALTAATATTAPLSTAAPRRTPERFAVTTFRITDAHWAWLRRQAFERALESGTKADASEIVREILDAAMQHHGVQ